MDPLSVAGAGADSKGVLDFLRAQDQEVDRVLRQEREAAELKAQQRKAVNEHARGLLMALNGDADHKRYTVNVIQSIKIPVSSRSLESPDANNAGDRAPQPAGFGASASPPDFDARPPPGPVVPPSPLSADIFASRRAEAGQPRGERRAGRVPPAFDQGHDFPSSSSSSSSSSLPSRKAKRQRTPSPEPMVANKKRSMRKTSAPNTTAAAMEEADDDDKAPRFGDVVGESHDIKDDASSLPPLDRAQRSRSRQLSADSLISDSSSMAVDADDDAGTQSRALFDETVADADTLKDPPESPPAVAPPTSAVDGKARYHVQIRVTRSVLPGKGKNYDSDDDTEDDGDEEDDDSQRRKVSGVAADQLREYSQLQLDGYTLAALCLIDHPLCLPAYAISQARCVLHVSGNRPTTGSIWCVATIYSSCGWSRVPSRQTTPRTPSSKVAGPRRRRNSTP